MRNRRLLGPTAVLLTTAGVPAGRCRYDRGEAYRIKMPMPGRVMPMPGP